MPIVDANATGLKRYAVFTFIQDDNATNLNSPAKRFPMSPHASSLEASTKLRHTELFHMKRLKSLEKNVLFPFVDVTFFSSYQNVVDMKNVLEPSDCINLHDHTILLQKGEPTEINLKFFSDCPFREFDKSCKSLLVLSGCFEEVQLVDPKRDMILTPIDHDDPLSERMAGGRGVTTENKVRPNDSSATAEDHHKLTRGYIVIAYKTMEHMYSRDFVSSWKTWTGVRYICMQLPRQLGLRRIAFYRQISTTSDFTYVLVIEIINLLVYAAQTLNLMDSIKLRLCGYTGIFKEADFQLDLATASVHHLETSYRPPDVVYRLNSQAPNNHNRRESTATLMEARHPPADPIIQPSSDVQILAEMFKRKTEVANKRRKEQEIAAKLDEHRKNKFFKLYRHSRYSIPNYAPPPPPPLDFSDMDEENNGYDGSSHMQRAPRALPESPCSPTIASPFSEKSPKSWITSQQRISPVEALIESHQSLFQPQLACSINLESVELTSKPLNLTPDPYRRMSAPRETCKSDGKRLSQFGAYLSPFSCNVPDDNFVSSRNTEPLHSSKTPQSEFGSNQHENHRNPTEITKNGDYKQSVVSFLGELNFEEGGEFNSPIFSRHEWKKQHEDRKKIDEDQIENENDSTLEIQRENDIISEDTDTEKRSSNSDSPRHLSFRTISKDLAGVLMNIKRERSMRVVPKRNRRSQPDHYVPDFSLDSATSTMGSASMSGVGPSLAARRQAYFAMFDNSSQQHGSRSGRQSSVTPTIHRKSMPGLALASEKRVNSMPGVEVGYLVCKRYGVPSNDEIEVLLKAPRSRSSIFEPIPGGSPDWSRDSSHHPENRHQRIQIPPMSEPVISLEKNTPIQKEAVEIVGHNYANFGTTFQTDFAIDSTAATSYATTPTSQHLSGNGQSDDMEDFKLLISTQIEPKSFSESKEAPIQTIKILGNASGGPAHPDLKPKPTASNRRGVSSSSPRSPEPASHKFARGAAVAHGTGRPVKGRESQQTRGKAAERRARPVDKKNPK